MSSVNCRRALCVNGIDIFLIPPDELHLCIRSITEKSGTAFYITSRTTFKSGRRLLPRLPNTSVATSDECVYNDTQQLYETCYIMLISG